MKLSWQHQHLGSQYYVIFQLLQDIRWLFQESTQRSWPIIVCLFIKTSLLRTVGSSPPPLWLASQLCRDNFSPGTEWEAKWQGLDITNRLSWWPSREVSGMNLPYKVWVHLTRFRTRVGGCNNWKFKWGQTDDQFCDCGSPQTMKHIVEECPLRSFSEGIGIYTYARLRDFSGYRT